MWFKDADLQQRLRMATPCGKSVVIQKPNTALQTWGGKRSSSAPCIENGFWKMAQLPTVRPDNVFNADSSRLGADERKSLHARGGRHGDLKKKRKMKKIIINGFLFLCSFLYVHHSKADIGKLVNGQAMLTVDIVDFENNLQQQLSPYNATNVKIEKMYFQMDESITDGIPDLIFVCTYQLPNDPAINKVSALIDCELAENGSDIRIVNGGAGTTTCVAKNCPDGCMPKRGGCPPPCQAPDPDAKVQPECTRTTTSDGGSGLAKDLVKMGLSYLLGLLTK